MLAGNAKEIDKVETQFEALGKKVNHHRERLTLLEQKLIEQQHKERQEELDALTARENKAHVLDEKLIRDQYAKQVKALVDTLIKL